MTATVMEIGWRIIVTGTCSLESIYLKLISELEMETVPVVSMIGQIKWRWRYRPNGAGQLNETNWKPHQSIRNEIFNKVLFFFFFFFILLSFFVWIFAHLSDGESDGNDHLLAVVMATLQITAVFSRKAIENPFQESSTRYWNSTRQLISIELGVIPIVIEWER